MNPLVSRLAQVDWLSSTPTEGIAALVADAERWRLRSEAVVYTSGAAPERLFVLIDGRVGAWRARDDRRPDDATDGIWYFITDAALTTLCLENVITAIPYFATMRVLSERADVLAVPAAALDRLLQAYPGVGLEMARHVARRLQGFTEQSVDLALLDTSRRLAKYLVRLAGPDQVTSAMTQAELAARLGASRQSVNATLSRFLHRGWMTRSGPGRYRLVDVAALRLHAGDVPDTGAELFH